MMGNNNNYFSLHFGTALTSFWQPNVEIQLRVLPKPYSGFQNGIISLRERPRPACESIPRKGDLFKGNRLSKAAEDMFNSSKLA